MTTVPVPSNTIVTGPPVISPNENQHSIQKIFFVLIQYGNGTVPSHIDSGTCSYLNVTITIYYIMIIRFY